MLTALLVVLLLGSGGLYQAGYWDTWEDKKGEIAATIRSNVENGAKEQGENVPEVVLEKFPACAAEVLVTTATQLNCPLEMSDEPALEQLTPCIRSNPMAVIGVQMQIMQCFFEAQAAAGELEEAPAP